MAGNRAGSPTKKFVSIPSHEANLTEGGLSYDGLAHYQFSDGVDAVARDAHEIGALSQLGGLEQCGLGACGEGGAEHDTAGGVKHLDGG